MIQDGKKAVRSEQGTAAEDRRPHDHLFLHLLRAVSWPESDFFQRTCPLDDFALVLHVPFRKLDIM